MIDLELNTSKNLFVDFSPSGIFNKADSTYILTFYFSALSSEEKGTKPFLNVRCNGVFKLNNVNDLEDIPNFFYRNSIAILFPYLRAFVSIITNQANIPGIVLPTMNLSALENPLRENTKVK
jgi:preprotein translocase subunit SecB